MKPKEQTKNETELIAEFNDKLKENMYCLECGGKAISNPEGDNHTVVFKLKDVKQAARNLFDSRDSEIEAARQSAQKEIELKTFALEKARTEIIEQNSLLTQKDKEITDLNILILNERTEKQEQVRKLKSKILHPIFLKDEQFVDLLKRIDEIFPDCVIRR